MLNDALERFEDLVAEDIDESSKARMARIRDRTTMDHGLLCTGPIVGFRMNSTPYHLNANPFNIYIKNSSIDEDEEEEGMHLVSNGKRVWEFTLHAFGCVPFERHVSFDDPGDRPFRDFYTELCGLETVAGFHDSLDFRQLRIRSAVECDNVAKLRKRIQVDYLFYPARRSSLSRSASPRLG